ncbi:hypothetical protein AB3X52_13100 [Nocardioides sp. DS6]|uniref:Uncharacterized protein n=1 Tax=Nocardioides eburneus TaxID=3231482 RepID=A0ABV3T047_9ACTN
MKILTSDEFAAFPIGLAVELLHRYRKTPLVLPKSATAEQQLKSLASLLGDDSDPYTRVGGFAGSKVGHAVGDGLESVGHSGDLGASHVWHSVFG